MRRSSVMAITMWACGSGGHPPSPSAPRIVPQAQETPPEVELAVAGPDSAADTPHTRVRFTRTTPHGLTVTSTIQQGWTDGAQALATAKQNVADAANRVYQSLCSGYEPIPDGKA